MFCCENNVLKLKQAFPAPCHTNTLQLTSGLCIHSTCFVATQYAQHSIVTNVLPVYGLFWKFSTHL